MTIDTLPDDALLEIFAYYLLEDRKLYVEYTETWHTLVHVCRRWRHIVLETPRRVNLRIRCTSRTLVTALSNVWPALPIVITDNYLKVHPRPSFMEDADNIVAALELKDLVHEISLWNYPSPQLNRFAAADQSRDRLDGGDGILRGLLERIRSTPAIVLLEGHSVSRNTEAAFVHQSPREAMVTWLSACPISSTVLAWIHSAKANRSQTDQASVRLRRSHVLVLALSSLRLLYLASKVPASIWKTLSTESIRLLLYFVHM